MIYLKIAFLNIFRNKRRTFLTMLVIVFGITSIIIFGGYVQYQYWGLRESFIRTQLGHIQVYKKGYAQEGNIDPLQYLISDYEQVRRVIHEVQPEVRAVSAQLEFSGLVSTSEKTTVFIGKGIEPETDYLISSAEVIRRGRDISQFDVEAGILGIGLADGLGVNPGEFVTLLTSTKKGGINAVDFELKGVFKSGIKEYDDKALKIPLSLAQYLLNVREVSKLIILLKNTDDTKMVAQNLKSVFERKGFDLEIKSWDELAPFYHSVVSLYNGIFRFIGGIIGIIVIFSIANTLLMSVMERVNEIGTIRAMGATRPLVLQSFIYEGIIIGIIGGIIGVIIGIIMSCLININGIPMPAAPSMTRGYVAYIIITPQLLIYGFLLALVTAFISSIFPARKASKMKIVDALRHF